MQRLTSRKPDGTGSLATGISAEEAVQKLAGLEDMYDALCAEQAKLVAEIEKLKAAGKQKTTTYQQLLANKLLAMNLISRFDIYS